MKRQLQLQIYEIVSSEWPEAEITLDQVEVGYPPAGFGDHSSNIAMKLAPRLKKDPIEVAELIKDKLMSAPIPLESVAVVKPGFLNITLAVDDLQKMVGEINQAGSQWGSSELGKGQKVLVEFVSANPTGPIHLGNGRGGPLGDSLANVLAKAGFQVEREYYVNDFGNQVKILGHSVLKDDQAQYQGDYIDQLHDSIGAQDREPFEVGREAAVYILDKIIKRSLQKACIEFDNFFSEKVLHDSGEVEKILAGLKEDKLVYEQDDALWFRSTKFGDDKDRVVRKSTGEYTYFGSDIAYHHNKFDRGFTKLINIWGADHHGDVARLQGAMEALGHKGQLQIILVQFVRVIKDGQEFKMSKRRGTYVSLDDLLEEAGKDAVRFFFLMHSPDTHMDFDLDLAKERSDKNPVFYVQYAHARICSIILKSQTSNYKSQNNSADQAGAKLELLAHPKELELMRHLERFGDLVEDIVVSHEVHRLPYFALALADKFHSFYHECKVLDEANPELTAARLELAKAAKTVLAETMRLMGVEAVEKM